MFIRLSREQDALSIKELMSKCFGERENPCWLEDLDSRYLLAFDDNKLLALTGLCWSDEYDGYEIDYTCTHPEYRRKGIMHELFTRICSLTDEPIYCSCWKVPEKDKVNLCSLMHDFGFKEVIKNRVTWDTRYNCKSGKAWQCVYQKTHLDNGIVVREPCRCCEDLYLRERQTNN